MKLKTKILIYPGVSSGPYKSDNRSGIENVGSNPTARTNIFSTLINRGGDLF